MNGCQPFNFLLFDVLPRNYRDELDKIIWLEEKLMDLNHSNFDSISQELQSSVFIDVSRIQQVLSSMISIISIRRGKAKQFANLLSFFCSIQNSSKDQGVPQSIVYKNNLEAELWKYFNFTCRDLLYTPYMLPPFHLIYFCLLNKILDPGTLIVKCDEYQDTSNDGLPPHFFIFFCEFYSDNQEYFSKQLETFKSKYKDFEDSISNKLSTLFGNNFNSIHYAMEHGALQGSLRDIILTDNSDAFSDLIMKDCLPNEFQTTLSSSIFDPVQFYDDTQLFSFSAKTGAINIFKFLCVNYQKEFQRNKETFFNFAIMGGNQELIRLCSTNKFEIKHLINAIVFHNNANNM